MTCHKHDKDVYIYIEMLHTVLQKQTALTTYISSKQFLLFAFAGRTVAFRLLISLVPGYKIYMLSEMHKALASRQKTVNQCWLNVGPTSKTLDQR